MELQSTSQSKIDMFFLEVHKAVRILGMDALIDIIKYSSCTKEMTLAQQEMAENYIAIVCEEFQITKEDLYSLKRKNLRRDAIGICAMLMEQKLGLDNLNVSMILKKNPASISVYKHEIFKLNPKHPSDIETIKKLQNIKDRING